MCNAELLRVAKNESQPRNVIANFAFAALLICLTSLTVACGSGSANANSPNASMSSAALSLTPDSATVGSRQQMQFTARLSGTANTAVTWSASAGSISRDGFFTAPQVAANTPVVITVTSVSNPVTIKDATIASVSTHASTTVTITPERPLSITTSTLPAADASVVYSASLAAAGGKTPYQWSIASGSLPSGIHLLSSTGVIAGTAPAAGSYPLTAKVVDASGNSATASLKLTVSSSSNTGTTSSPATGFDGPAELPRIYIQSAMSNTPAPGSTITVNAGGNLQSALNNADCGDTIQLQAGATFSGTFTFPAKSCDENHWIIVRTSADDSSLPAEGTRLTPCYAGVASLPARPALNCVSPHNVLAKLILPTTGTGPVVFASGANHYRLMGLEITRAAATGIVYALSSVTNAGNANNIIFDRVWMHGTAQDETNRGVWLEGSTYISIVDSFLTDFHCVAISGSCGDAQAIAGGIGSGGTGPYKITDNFLEASGENILFGGGGATSIPADIQISQNHMFKPLTWMKGQPGYVGGRNGNPFVVKNLFELKNAQRVLFESNILEDTWGGFSQVGFGILLTPKNPGSTTPCPICQVTDVTIRYSTISHVGAGLQIANALSDNGTAALDGERYSIHDIVVDDIDGVKFDGPSEFAQVSVSAGAPPLQNVTINHVTAFPASTLFLIGDRLVNDPMKKFVFTNSIVNAGASPVWSTGGGPTNCAFSEIPLITFNTCFANSAFSGNAIIATPAEFEAVKWPSGNFFPESASSVGFVNYNDGMGGDYRLQPSSPYKGKGADGTDPGADVDAVNSAVASVE